MARVKAGGYGPPLLVFAVTTVVFVPVLHYPFLNWDDIDVFVRNDALHGPRLLQWAFTTRYLEHYQPLAWLTWGALDRTLGLTPHNAHALNIVLHAACAVLVFMLMRPFTGLASALVASLFWAIHPLRVEVVAWASAMPYALALLCAVLSMLAWLRGAYWTAVGLFTVSLLARPIAFGLPVIWIFIAPAWRPAIVGAGFAMAAAFAESSARLTASLSEFGVGPRLTLAASAPWRYLWRTVAPLNLTPLDPLALTPRTDVVAIVLGLSAIALVSAAAWRWRQEQPVLAVSWLAYLVLLAPAMGLVPSGLQATADRYTYLPGIAISVALAIATTSAFAGASADKKVVALPVQPMAPALPLALARRATTLVVAGCIAVLVGLATVTWQQLAWWRDSIALWTRAVEIDPRNDVALYNLGTALDEAGRRDEALARYEQVVALVPTHREARRNRDLLRAQKFEEEGNRLAASGRLAEAVARYSDAVRLDRRRTHSHAGLGMALTQLGRSRDARPHLETAIDQGVNDPSIPNALAFGLAQAGDRDGALAVLRAAQRRFPNDPNIARNLAMLSGDRR